jgi:hypothetical protein
MAVIFTFFTASFLLFFCDDKPSGAGVIGFQQAIGTFDDFKAGNAEQIADHGGGVDGFTDVFLEL